MGLDQFAYLAKKKNEDVKDIYFSMEELEEDCEVVDERYDYWQKYHSLQDWMQNLAYTKDSYESIEEFNGVIVNLTRSDIDNLEEDVRSGDLDFSWDSHGREERHILEFCERARDDIAVGYEVFYDSWG